MNITVAMPRNTGGTAAQKEKGGRRAKKGSPSTPLKPASPPPHQQTPHQTPHQTPKVPGSRMSGVKHSGLLAKDKRTQEPLLEVADTIYNLKLGSAASFEAADTEEGLDEYPLIPGREIYSFQGRKKPSQKTPAGKKLQNVVERSSHVTSGTPQLGKSKREQAAKRVTALEDAVSDSSGTEEAMEVDISQVEKGKDVLHRIPTDSDTDLSDMSEEDMANIAARLNQGEAIGQGGEEMLEDYFTAHAEKADMTSDHTLSKLSRPKLDEASVQRVLKAAPSLFRGDCQSLYSEYRKLYSYWLFQMSAGYNILLYGLGSKRKLIEDFRNKHLGTVCHLVVNGYFPGITVKHILSMLTSDLLEHSGTFKSYTEQAQFVCQTLHERSTNSETPKEVFLVVHNIDGAMLRGEKIQTALSILAHSSHIHVIASIDHINAPLIWDQKKLGRFNWLWHDVTTYELYQEETSYENSFLVQRSGTLVLSSLRHVMKSLTPNARGIFELLAKHQLEHKEGDTEGMSFHACYLKCREKFLVNSDLTLRAQLTEFYDHKLVRLHKGSDGGEYLHIPIDDTALAQFLEEQTESV